MQRPLATWGLVFALLWLACATAFAQGPLDARLEPARIEVGDAFQLVVSVPLTGPKPDVLDLSAWEPFFPQDQIIGRTGWLKAGDSVTQRIHIVALDSGRFQLPPVFLLMSDGARLYSGPLYLSVQVPPPPKGMADIRDIISAPVNWTAWLLPILLLLAGLGLFAILWRRLRQRLRKSKVISQMLALSPIERARGRLRKLREKRLVEAGNFDAYYLELSAILREYIHTSNALPGPDATTEMLAPKLAPLDSGGTALALLRRADLVKFAKALPNATQAEADWKACADWIENFEKKRT